MNEMQKTRETKKLDYSYCKAAPLLELFANKWNMVVLFRLHESGAMRFNELYRTIPSVSEKVLAQTLDRLHKSGFISRTVYPEAPPRVVYDLAELSLSLYPLLESLKQWGIEHYDNIMEHRHAAVH